MQISLKNAVITALAVGGAIAATAANAANVVVSAPSTGTSQLLFFVVDTTAHTSYTRVLTQTVTNAASGGIFNSTIATSSSTQGVINKVTGEAGFTVNTGADAALNSFISGAGTDTLSWGIIAGAGVNLSSTPGNLVAVATATGPSADSSVYTQSNGTFQGSMIGSNTGGGLAADINRLNGTGTNDGNGVNATTHGVIGSSSSVKANTLTFYGAGVAMGGLALGSSATLYGMTTSGPSGNTLLAYNLGSASLSADGKTLTFSGNTVSAVPLPAAVWLLGSGLLGLAGVGRRRAAKTEAV